MRLLAIMLQRYEDAFFFFDRRDSCVFIRSRCPGRSCPVPRTRPGCPVPRTRQAGSACKAFFPSNKTETHPEEKEVWPAGVPLLPLQAPSLNKGVYADSYDRFAGAKTHSGAFAGFAIKKLTADDLGDTCKPDRSASCPMAACKGKLMTGHDTNEDAENIYDKLDISKLCKQCFDLDYADGEVSMCVSEQRFPTDASHALASACCARDSISTGLLGFVCQGRS